MDTAELDFQLPWLHISGDRKRRGGSVNRKVDNLQQIDYPNILVVLTSTSLSPPVEVLTPAPTSNNLMVLRRLLHSLDSH